MEMSPETIKALLDAFERSDWREMVVEVGEDSLHVSRDPLPAAAPPASTPAQAQVAGEPAVSSAGGTVGGTTPEEALATGGGGGSPAVTGPAEETAPAKGTKIEAPSVGLFWRAPSPGAPPFVEVGGTVAAGETVAIVEVMKLMNHVSSPVDGVVTAILVENGAAVEFGQAIVIVDPEG